MEKWEQKWNKQKPPILSGAFESVRVLQVRTTLQREGCDATGSAGRSARPRGPSP